MDESCHLVLVSRTLPEIPDLPLLVARDEVGGLDFSDLAFRQEEIRALFAQNEHLEFSDEDTRRLVEATEGWIAAIQFADLGSLRSGQDPFPARHAVGVSVFDYLGQQVLEQQAKDLQVFLLRTSLLEEFDSGLVRGRAGAAVLRAARTGRRCWKSFARRICTPCRWARTGSGLDIITCSGTICRIDIDKEFPQEVTPVLQRLAAVREKQGEWEAAYQLYQQLGDQARAG